MNLHFERQVLPNGLRLITAPMHDTKAVTILILVGAGSRYETARTNGVAHFLEHMFFKGTTNRPSTLDISKELDGLGADYNAFTGEEHTGFYVRVAGDDFAQGFDVITDMLLNPLFLAEEIEREKGVIVEELNMYEDTPTRAIHDAAKSLTYGDTPLGRNIGGSKATVTKLDRPDFVNFRTQFYQPDNLIVVIAGAGHATAWREAVADRLGRLKGRASQQFEAAITGQKKPRVRLVDKPTDQAHLLLNFSGLAHIDPRRPQLAALINILGGTMSSRLFTEVRERRGLAYYVGASQWNFRDTGALTARAGVQVAKITEAVQVILAEFRRLVTTPVADEELERAKKNIRGGLYLGLEDSMAIADYLGEQELLLGRIEQPEEKIKQIDAVTQTDLSQLAQSLIRRETLNLTVISPSKNTKQFETLVQTW